MKMIPSQPSVRLSIIGICRRSLQVVAFTAMTLQLVMIFMKTTTVSSFSILPVLPSRTATSHPGTTGTRTSSTILYENNSNNNGGSSGGLLSDFFNAGKAKLMKNMAGEYDSTAVQEQIKTYIQNNPVLMLSFDTCPFCVKAKSILDSKNIQYVIYIVCCFFWVFVVGQSHCRTFLAFICSIFSSFSDIQILIYVRM